MKENSLKVIQYKANLLLQILLQLNVYLSAIWGIIYGFHIFYYLSNLRDLQSILIVIGYVLAIVVECGRLYAGYSGNLRAKTADLSNFLVLTPLIQLPILLFLFLSAKSENILITITTYAIFVLIFFEILLGIFTWRKLTYIQTELYKLKREYAKIA